MSLPKILLRGLVGLILLWLILANVMLGLPYVLTSVLAGLRKFDPARWKPCASSGSSSPDAS